MQYREDFAGTYRRVLPQWQCDIERISPDVPKGTSAQSLLEALVAQISCGLAREIRAREEKKSYAVHSACTDGWIVLQLYTHNDKKQCSVEPYCYVQ